MGLLEVTNDLIILGCEDKIRFYDLKSGSLVYNYSQDSGNGSVDFIKLSNDSGLLGVGFSDKAMIVFKIKSEQQFNISVVFHTTLKKRATAIAFHVTPDSSKLFVADKSGDLYEYFCPLHGSRESTSNPILGHVSMLLDVEASLDGKYLITADRDEKIRISLLNRPFEIENFCLGHEEFAHSVKVLQNDKLLSSSGDGTLRLWDIKTGSQIVKIEFNEEKCVQRLQNFASVLTVSSCEKFVCAASQVNDHTDIKIYEKRENVIKFKYEIKNGNSKFLSDVKFTTKDGKTMLFLLTTNNNEKVEILNYELTDEAYNNVENQSLINLNSAIADLKLEEKSEHLSSLFKAKLSGNTYLEYAAKKEKRLAEKNGCLEEIENKRIKA